MGPLKKTSRGLSRKFNLTDSLTHATTGSDYTSSETGRTRRLFIQLVLSSFHRSCLSDGNISSRAHWLDTDSVINMQSTTMDPSSLWPPKMNATTHVGPFPTDPSLCKLKPKHKRTVIPGESEVTGILFTRWRDEGRIFRRRQDGGKESRKKKIFISYPGHVKQEPSAEALSASPCKHYLPPCSI